MADGFGSVSYTHLDVYKRQESYHPVSHKMAALNSFCYRAINYFEDDSCKTEELKRIEEIAKNNNYKLGIVEKIVKRIEGNSRQEEKKKRNT